MYNKYIFFHFTVFWELLSKMQGLKIFIFLTNLMLIFIILLSYAEYSFMSWSDINNEYLNLKTYTNKFSNTTEIGMQ